MSHRAWSRPAVAAVCACVALLSACSSTESAAPAATTTPTTEPAPSVEPVAQTVPAHDACALLDPSLLSAAGFSGALHTADLNPADLAYKDVLAVYGCGNDQGEVVFDVSLHTSVEAARAEADGNADVNLLPGDSKVAFGPDGGGTKIINTDLGVSTASWSNGTYSVLLSVASDPIIPGIAVKHSFDKIDAMIDAIVVHADPLLASGNW